MSTTKIGVPGKSNETISDGLVGDPLDKRKVEVTKDGQKIMVPAMNIGFMEKRQFVLYKPLPASSLTKAADESLTAGEEEWLERVSYLEDDLHWLLMLPYHMFWSQVVYDEELHHCLESYLTYAPREHDLQNDVREDLLLPLRKVHRLVFLVYLRMSTYKESKMDHMTSSGFGDIIYDNFLFDIPKMMDICVLYGSRNKVLLTKMISNIFTSQPNYFSDLKAVVPNLLLVFDNVEMKLGLHSTLDDENQRPVKLGEERTPSISSMTLSSLMDISYYIMDSSVTLGSFLEIFAPACNILFKFGISTRIGSFYDRVFPAIEMELNVRSRQQMEHSQIIEKTKLKLGLARTYLVRMFRNLISSSCLQPLMESRCESMNGFNASESSHLEEFMKIFTEVVSEKHFIRAYNNLFPFDSDVEMLAEADISLDPTRLDYIFNSIHQNEDIAAEKNGDFHVSNSSHYTKNSSMQNGLETKPIENLQGLASALADKSSAVLNGNFVLPSDTSTTSTACHLSSLQIDSLIQAVLDVLPSYGPGFIEECLKYHKFNSEKVIDSLLQGNLPHDLETLDPFLQRKVLANDNVSIDDMPATVLSDRRNVFDYDEFDIFNRVDVDMEKIHQGKRDKTPHQYEGLSSSKSDDFSLLKEASLNYSSMEDIRLEELALYDDEYDDTYDSVMVGVDERQTEKELQTFRPFTIPRVLEQNKRKERITEEIANYQESSNYEEEVIEEELPPKRDEFVPNPEILRERAEQRRQEKAAARGRRNPLQKHRSAPEGSDKQSQNRQQKEKQKSRVANHSRKNQSSWKKSRGMVPFPTR